MRTTLNIDEQILADVIKATGEKSKTKAVNKAMEEYVRVVRIQHLLSLEGKLDLDLDDWYEFRHMEHDLCQAC